MPRSTVTGKRKFTWRNRGFGSSPGIDCSDLMSRAFRTVQHCSQVFTIGTKFWFHGAARFSRPCYAVFRAQLKEFWLPTFAFRVVKRPTREVAEGSSKVRESARRSLYLTFESFGWFESATNHKRVDGTASHFVRLQVAGLQGWDSSKNQLLSQTQSLRGDDP